MVAKVMKKDFPTAKKLVVFMNFRFITIWLFV